jgi:hypothetical protein
MTFIGPRQEFRARPHRGIKKRANGREREYEKLESRQGAIRNVRDGLDLVTPGLTVIEMACKG